ncbi:hypothetical protein ACEQ8H_008679 [Pleosporales sp. CAS-2024a]
MLDKSKALKRTTLCVLNDFCKTLGSGLYKYAQKGDPATDQLRIHNSRIYSQTKWLLKEIEDSSDSESDSDTGSDSGNSGDEISGGMCRLAEDIKMHVQCLIDLSNALEYPAIDPEPTDEPSVLRVEQRAAHDYHTGLITAKFPKMQDELAESLGRTSWNRYLRMQNEREINATNTMYPAPEEMDGSALKSRMAGSDFKDSGLGTSLPAPPTRYAETVISFMTSITGGNRVQIPPLPPQAKIGAQFECNACGRQIRAVNNRDWRKHLFLDLQPYTCLFTGCAFSTQPFVDRQLWSNHLELDHQLGPDWKSVVCPICLESTDNGKGKMLIHFARHMEDIALAALPRDVESDDESESGTFNESSESVSAEKDRIDAPIPAAKNSGFDLPRTTEDANNFSIKSDIDGRRLWYNGSMVSPPTYEFNRTHPAMINSDFSICRCKLYELKNNGWYDNGTGHAKVVQDSLEQWNIVVWSEDDIRRLLLEPISGDSDFQKQQGSLIAWTTSKGVDMALSFSEPKGCDVVWLAIRQVLGFDR